VGREVKRRSDDLNCQVSKNPKEKIIERKVAIEKEIRSYGYSPVRELTGHGIGRVFFKKYPPAPEPIMKRSREGCA